jgi:hypothetical protein
MAADRTHLTRRNNVRFNTLIIFNFSQCQDRIVAACSRDIVVIAGDVSRTTVGLSSLLLCHQGAQLNDDTVHIRACSNHALICCFEDSNLNC